jgi:hypothetical protein
MYFKVRSNPNELMMYCPILGLTGISLPCCRGFLNKTDPPQLEIAYPHLQNPGGNIT